MSSNSCHGPRARPGRPQAERVFVTRPVFKPNETNRIPWYYQDVVTMSVFFCGMAIKDQLQDTANKVTESPLFWNSVLAQLKWGFILFQEWWPFRPCHLNRNQTAGACL